MRIVCVSDLHLDHTTHGIPRFEELRKTLFGPVLRTVVERKADAFLFLGDLCDPDLHAPATICAIETALELASRLHGFGVPSVWLAGNHDVVESGDLITTLSPLRHAPGAMVIEEPARFFLREQLDVVAFPYTSSANAYDPEEWARAQVRPGRLPMMTISHLAIEGVQPGEEVTELPRGREVVFPEELTRGACLRLSGHYHRAQSFVPKGSELPIEIVGTSCVLTFSEEGNRPSILVVEV